MKKSVFIAIGFVVVVVVGIVVKESLKSGGGNGGGFRGGPREVAVQVETVSSQPIELKVEAVGTTNAKESVEITSNVTETIESIHFSDGNRVKKGDVLVVLTNNEEQADLESAKANLAEQEREVKRLEGLVKSKSVSQSMLDERLTLRETAQHRVDAVEARLRDRVIRAPFSGVLGLREVSPGTLVSPGTVITTLDDVDLMKLDFAVPEVYLTAVTPGVAIKARSPALAERLFEGRIVSVDSRINPIDRSIKVRAELPNKDNAIKPGMLMNVDILVENREALVVPESSIIQRGDQHFVYVVSESTPPTVQQRSIDIGIRKPGIVEVVGGLQAGDVVVSKGTGTVSPGAIVRIAEAPELTSNR